MPVQSEEESGGETYASGMQTMVTTSTPGTSHFTAAVTKLTASTGTVIRCTMLCRFSRSAIIYFYNYVYVSF